jgi:hypothetical protein
MTSLSTAASLMPWITSGRGKKCDFINKGKLCLPSTQCGRYMTPWPHDLTGLDDATMCPLYCKHPKVFRRDNKLLLVERPQHYSIFLPHSLHMLQKQYVINAMTRFVATVYSHKPWRCMKGSISEWHSNRQGDSLQYGRRTKSGNSTRTY